ncbi:hypothetical protein BESB_024200 [Besnoitia besnoiti]|uniref:Protein kinase domain-containing protein n=1 Tax=Besnoitia besnoiti TaxID=94643 RepID=A0A2A9M003_BESBE|nr:hypothetical protein BESB_024200 [Besnoitia besnoiti]PFH31928.1 hypothetical protein BESB_024200 [Besnoitia besnoiti]
MSGLPAGKPIREASVRSFSGFPVLLDPWSPPEQHTGLTLSPDAWVTPQQAPWSAPAAFANKESVLSSSLVKKKATARESKDEEQPRRKGTYEAVPRSSRRLLPSSTVFWPSHGGLPSASPVVFAQEGVSGAGETSEEPNGGAGGTGSPLDFLDAATEASLSNPPPLSEDGSPLVAAARSQEITIASSLPFCELEWDALGPLLGAGSYGRVYALRYLGDCDAAKEFSDRTFGVKLFRCQRGGAIQFLEEVDGNSAPASPDILKAIQRETRNIPADRAFQEMVRLLNPKIDLPKWQVLGEHLTPDLVAMESKTLRALINTKYYYLEMRQTNMLFQRIEAFIQRIRPDAWASVQEASERARALKYAEIGFRENHWNLPLGRVIVTDRTGFRHWGLIFDLYQGDLEPVPGNTDFTLDGWNPASHRNAKLKQILQHRDSLLSLTSKVVKPFLAMHNRYGVGHFDIKPSNLLYKVSPGDNGRPPRLSVAAADFGMATPLRSPMPIQGTLNYMAPDMERVPGGLKARPEFDVYALGLTLASFWTVGTNLVTTPPWVEFCIKPALLQGAAEHGGSKDFTMQRFKSRAGPRIFSPRTLTALISCFAPGGLVDKLYHTEMPYLVRLKISQMIEPDPLVRVSMRHAHFLFKALWMAEQLSSETTEAGSRLADEAKLAKFQQIPLVQFLLYYLDLEPLSPGRDNRKAYLRLSRAMLEFGELQPLQEAALEVVQPLGLDSFRHEQDWVRIVSAISDREAEAVLARTRAKLTKGIPVSEAAWMNLIDLAFGVTRNGMHKLARRAVYTTKTRLLEQTVGATVGRFVRSIYTANPNVQLVAEDPPPPLFKLVRAELGMRLPEASQLGKFVDRCVAKSYIGWATIDRLLRKALRYTSLHGSSQAVGPAALAHETGSDSAPEHGDAFYDEVAASLQVVTERSHYGLPWTSSSLSSFGKTASEMREHLRSVLIPQIANMWPSATQRRILYYSVKTAVRALETPLPVSLQAVYETVFGALPTHAHIPPPFLVGQERGEYAEILYQSSLASFKEMVAYWATRQELRVAVERALDQLGGEANNLTNEEMAERMEKYILPEHIRTAPPQRFGWQEGMTHENILSSIKQRRDELRRLGRGFVEHRIQVNGKALPPQDASSLFHAILEKPMLFRPTLSVLEFSQYFTHILKKSFDPRCRKYVAELRIQTSSSPMEFRAVPAEAKLASLFARDRGPLKLVAVDPDPPVGVQASVT